MDSQTLTKEDIDVQKPKLYAVIIHNDDITTMDFVVDVLMQIFNKSTVEAASLMMDVHEKGHGIAGVYTYDIACTKVMQTNQRAAEKNFPLKLTIEEVDE